MTKTRLSTAILGTLAIIGGIAIAQPPKQNINAGRHPNLARAQHQCAMASQSITAAQEANEWDMQGHAKHAKQLLDEASNELRAAATAANRAK